MNTSIEEVTVRDPLLRAQPSSDGGAHLDTAHVGDIRGALGLGFDEGSWISTIFSAAQMLVTPAAAWMSVVSPFFNG